MPQFQNRKAKSADQKLPALPPLSAVSAFLDSLAPPHLAEPWDNVGLLAGHPDSLIQKILLTIDLTPAVHKEAIRFFNTPAQSTIPSTQPSNLLLAYHPPIFKPLKNLVVTGQQPTDLALELHARGIALYSPHTALDTAPDGTNDTLAAAIGATVTGAFGLHPGHGEYLKLVTFIPEGDVEKVADAVFNAGAGHIGQKSKYQKCSFRTSGHGTFQGDESSNPAVGTAGRYERVPEIRFETILPARLAPEVIAALRAAHPYEEPAFDLLKTQTPPEAIGLGRYATLPKSMPLAALAARCKKALGISHVQMINAINAEKSPTRPIQTLALLAGSAGRLPLEQARGFDCLITGELKHHDMLAYAAAGIPVLALGHCASERPVLAVLQKKIAAAFPMLKVQCSTADCAPFTTL